VRKEQAGRSSLSPHTPHTHSVRRERTRQVFYIQDDQDESQETPVSILSQNANHRDDDDDDDDAPPKFPGLLDTCFDPPTSPTSQPLGTPSPDTMTGPPSPPSFLQAPSMVATPPVADQDLDPQSSVVEIEQDSLPLESSAHTIPDASLPSPLLSPVSAGSPATPSAGEDEDSESFGFDLVRLPPDPKTLQLQHIPASSMDITPNASPLEITSMVDTFDSYPAELQQYLMYQFLRRCSKTVLQFTAAIVNPALKCDFLSRLPTELSLSVVRYLDAQSLCRCAQVSKTWRQLVDTDESLWRDLIHEDGFVLPKGEVDRAVREGWKWQGLAPREVDLRKLLSSCSPGSMALPSPSESGRSSLKRKDPFQEEPSKRRKTTHPHPIGEPCSWAVRSSDVGRPPATAIDSAVAGVADIPELGLTDLRIPRLYKSIYRRHHGFRTSWMDPQTEPQHLAFPAHGRHVVTCLQFDNDKILTGSDDTKIHVYNTSTGALAKQLDGHEGGVWALQYDGNTLVSGSTDRTVRVWDVEKGRCRHVFQGHTSTVRCLVILKPAVVGHKEDGTPIMMPREPLIITGSRDSTLRIWALPKPGDAPFNPTGQTMTRDDQNPYFIRALSGHIHSVRAIAAHGDTLVSGSYDSTVRVWRISTGEVLHRLNGHAQKVYSVILDHERNRCISGSMDNLVKVWSLETGQCIFNLDGHSSLVGLLDLNNGRLVSAAADWTLRVWDPETGHCRNILEAHTGAITCFQHDHQKVISGSDRTLKMWDVRTGRCVRDLLTDLSGGWQVKFNDRKCVAAVQRNHRTYIEVRRKDSFNVVQC
jgi:F-box and WD-40 domain protein CDC4